MANGAPAALLDAALRAALDELRHAASCVDLADSGPRRMLLPPHTLTVERGAPLLAAKALREGCVGETVAAAVAAAAAAVAAPRPAAAQRAIASDEARHAAVAWATVAWALRTPERAGVLRELRAAEADVRRQLDGEAVRDDGECPVPSAALLPFGRVEGAAQDVVTRRALRAVVLPMIAALYTGAPLPDPVGDGAPEAWAHGAVVRETAALVAAL